MRWKVYLAGEIHTPWRDEVTQNISQAQLPIDCLAPVVDHNASDDCGITILGSESDPFWHDHKGAKLNAIRTRTLLKQADIVVVKFGEKYKQWNAAFDAGYAAALGKSLIVVHAPELRHALKEIDAAAQSVCERTDQVVEVLRYVTVGTLPS